MVMLVPQPVPDVATPVFETIETTCGAADIHTTEVVMSLLSGGWMKVPIAWKFTTTPAPVMDAPGGLIAIDISFWSCPQLERPSTTPTAIKTRKASPM